VATCDLTGRVIGREEFPTDPDADKVSDSIIDRVRKFVKADGGNIEGIGVSVPALVDSNKGDIVYSPHFNWRNPRLIERVRDATGLNVHADNDANAAAIAELWFGRPEIQDTRDFILVYIESGIGTGIVSDGQLYRGKGGVAGEFGHMRIGTDAPVRCATGSRECWEAFASERAALARYALISGNGGRNGDARLSFSMLVDLALTDNAAAAAALKETARYIGIGMGNLIQGLSPEVIVVGGTIVRAWSLVAGEITQAAEGVVCQGIPSTRIIASTLGSEPGLMGAFSLVLADKFASISI
jgi:predicted NBD/HSP70 family sugar kinase